MFVPGQEILVAASAEQVISLLRELPDEEREAIGQRARARIAGAHTAAHRAAELDQYVLSARHGRVVALQSAAPPSVDASPAECAQEGA